MGSKEMVKWIFDVFSKRKREYFTKGQVQGMLERKETILHGRGVSRESMAGLGASLWSIGTLSLSPKMREVWG